MTIRPSIITAGIALAFAVPAAAGAAHGNRGKGVELASGKYRPVPSPTPLARRVMAAGTPPRIILVDPAGVHTVCNLANSKWYVCGFKVVVYVPDPGDRRPK